MKQPYFISQIRAISKDLLPVYYCSSPDVWIFLFEQISGNHTDAVVVLIHLIFQTKYVCSEDATGPVLNVCFSGSQLSEMKFKSHEIKRQKKVIGRQFKKRCSLYFRMPYLATIKQKGASEFILLC